MKLLFVSFSSYYLEKCNKICKTLLKHADFVCRAHSSKVFQHDRVGLLSVKIRYVSRNRQVNGVDAMDILLGNGSLDKLSCLLVSPLHVHLAAFRCNDLRGKRACGQCDHDSVRLIDRHRRYGTVLPDLTWRK